MPPPMKPADFLGAADFSPVAISSASGATPEFQNRPCLQIRDAAVSPVALAFGAIGQKIAQPCFEACSQAGHVSTGQRVRPRQHRSAAGLTLTHGPHPSSINRRPQPRHPPPAINPGFSIAQSPALQHRPPSRQTRQHDGDRGAKEADGGRVQAKRSKLRRHPHRMLADTIDSFVSTAAHRCLGSRASTPP